MTSLLLIIRALVIQKDHADGMRAYIFESWGLEGISLNNFRRVGIPGDNLESGWQ